MTTWTLPELMTVWIKGASDGFGGFNYTRADDVPARLANKVDKIISNNGTEYVTNKRIYTNYDINNGDFVLLVSSTDSTPPQGAKEIRATSKIPTATNLKMAVA
jgi:hypothetical protein